MKAFTGIKYIIIKMPLRQTNSNAFENEKIFIYLSAEIETELEKKIWRFGFEVCRGWWSVQLESWEKTVAIIIWNQLQKCLLQITLN